MGTTRLLAGLLLVCSTLSWGLPKAAKKPAVKPSSESIAVTTNSPAARKLFEEGMVLAENLRNTEAEPKFAAAAKTAPDFALAHAFEALLSRDPKVSSIAGARAKALGQKVTKGERLMIRWINGQREDNFVAAIAAMNDMRALYPNDKRSAFFVGKWLIQQERYDKAIEVLEAALKVDPNYAPALNEIGYAYAYSGQQEKGIEALKKYVALLPNEPNPHDSLAELNRLAGHYDEALNEYREALKILPRFNSSQLGLGDTYALMGQQQKAREEYAKAIAAETSVPDAFDYRFQNAITYLREKDIRNADKALAKLGEEADRSGMAEPESDAHRAMAMYSHDIKKALEHLKRAEDALHKHALSQTAREQATARILRVRAFRAADAGRSDIANASVEQLASMAKDSRDEVVQRSYHAANGALLYAGGKYAEAASELQDDPDNTISLMLLAQAQEKSGNAAEAKATRDKIASQHKVLIEDVISKLGPLSLSARFFSWLN